MVLVVDSTMMKMMKKTMMMRMKRGRRGWKKELQDRG